MPGEAYDNQSDEEHEWLKWSNDGTSKDKDQGPHCREEELSHSSNHRATGSPEASRIEAGGSRDRCDLNGCSLSPMIIGYSTLEDEAINATYMIEVGSSKKYS
ncbi:hypothetical protein KEM48_000050 [Puccinia striiformis f. sp. tritici PST-130]|nr:hypothetical protein KEM48_000050 [Puccinia striiformis f. sp. tritici PST-130]